MLVSLDSSTYHARKLPCRTGQLLHRDYGRPTYRAVDGHGLVYVGSQKVVISGPTTGTDASRSDALFGRNALDGRNVLFSFGSREGVPESVSNVSLE